jgi:hypothetical protein
MHLRPIFIAVQGFSLEDFKIPLVQVFLVIDLCIVQEMPESDGAVTGASDEPCDAR